MENRIGKLMHDIRGSMQVCCGFVGYVKRCVENGELGDIAAIKDYSELASTSMKRVLSFLDELEVECKKSEPQNVQTAL